MNICKNCGKVYTDKKFDIAVCSRKCKIEYQRIKRIEKSKEKFADKPHCECRICGFRAQSLATHIKLVHNININEYREKFNLSLDDVILPSIRESNAEKQRQNIKAGKHPCFTSENNPAKGKECKNGRNSPFSMNFRGYDGLTNEEKKQKIKLITNKSIKSMNERGNNPLTVDYYLNRGMTLEEAKLALKNRQSTFSKEKCIAKYGEEEGLKRWQERQNKWQSTLSSLSKEEQERIMRAKMSNSRGYSMISQELFWDIYLSIKLDFKEIYFATLKDGCRIDSEHAYHNEYYVCEDGRHFFLDFLIKDNMKVIEFDGDYWHSERIDPNKKQKDAEREAFLIKHGYKIFHVKECNYRENKERVIEEVLNFIYKG